MAKWSISVSTGNDKDRALVGQMASRAKNLDILASALQRSGHLGTSLAAELAPAEPLSCPKGASVAAKLHYE